MSDKGLGQHLCKNFAQFGSENKPGIASLSTDPAGKPVSVLIIMGE